MDAQGTRECCGPISSGHETRCRPMLKMPGGRSNLWPIAFPPVTAMVCREVGKREKGNLRLSRVLKMQGTRMYHLLYSILSHTTETCRGTIDREILQAYLSARSSERQKRKPAIVCVWSLLPCSSTRTVIGWRTRHRRYTPLTSRWPVSDGDNHIRRVAAS
jgi:hypothetical protein